MAAAEIRPDWTIGTLNLTSGSVEFTTNDSLLQTAAIQPGDEIITASGLVLIIASITGQNSGTLMEPCPADAAGSGQPLRIRFQPDGSRYNGATADLVQLLGSGNVYEFAGLDGSGGGVPVFTGTGTMDVVPSDEVGVQDPNGNLGEFAGLDGSGGGVPVFTGTGTMDVVPSDEVGVQDPNGNLGELAGLVGAADTMPYFTGVGAMGLTGLTAFARSLLDDANAEAMLGTLGLNGNSIARQVLETYGVYYNSASGVSPNDAVAGDRALYSNDLPGTPNAIGVGNWWIETQRLFSTDAVRQIATSYNGSSTYNYNLVRNRNANGVWSEWEATTLNYGSNVNGRFMFAVGGLQFCIGLVAFTTPSSLATWVFPRAFSSAPAVLGIGFGSTADALTVQLTSRTETQAGLRAVRGAVGDVAMNAPVLAVGEAL